MNEQYQKVAYIGLRRKDGSYAVNIPLYVKLDEVDKPSCSKSVNVATRLFFISVQLFSNFAMLPLPKLSILNRISTSDNTSIAFSIKSCDTSKLGFSDLF